MALEVYSLAHKAKVKVSALMDKSQIGYGKADPTTLKYKVGSGAPAAYKGHNGVDTYSTDGSPIYSVCDGIVRVSKLDPTAGNYVSIGADISGKEHHFLYMHMKYLPTVKKGQKVKKGDLIGYQGNTGNSHGSHLHFGAKVVVNGVSKFADPLPYLIENEKENIIMTGETGLYKINAQGLRIRNKPVNGEVVGTMENGAEVKISAVYIDTDSGVWGKAEQGWACLATDKERYAEKIGDLPDVSVIDKIKALLDI